MKSKAPLFCIAILHGIMLVSLAYMFSDKNYKKGIEDYSAYALGERREYIHNAVK